MATNKKSGTSRKRKSDDVAATDDPPENDTERNIHLAEAILYFSDTRERPAKIRGNIQMQLSLEKIESVAAETGLSADDIITLMDVITRSHFTDRILSRLIKHLIPATVTPSHAIMLAVSWMCTNKPSSTIQALLIHWMVLIYDSIDKLEDLHALYGIIFYFTQNEVMCPKVCHLLYLMTRKDDVRVFRIYKLLRLQRKMGVQPYLQGLLSIYHVYCPRYIVIQRANKVFFRLTDRVWSSRVKNVLDRRKVEHPLSDINTRLMSQPAKRARKELLIPPIGTNMISEDTASWGVVSAAQTQTVPFSHITSFKLLLQNFDRLELPGQIAAALSDRNLQHVLMCYPDRTIATRIAYWLNHVLCEEFVINPSKDRTRGEELLKTLIIFSEFLKEGVPVCEHFLVQYLHIWNGTDFRPLILKLVTRFRLYTYQKLHESVLEPLRKLFVSSSLYFKCQIMKTLTILLQNLVAVELPRYQYCCHLQEDNADPLRSVEEKPNNHCVFVEKVDIFNAEDTIHQYIEHVNNLVVLGLLLEGGHPLFMHCLLNFYAVVCDLHHDYNLPWVILPHKAVFYYTLFTTDATSLARICHLICRYRENFTLLRKIKPSDIVQVYKEESIQNIRSLNTYLLDYCDSLWRMRAFTSQERNTIYNLTTEECIQELCPTSYSQLYSLHRHPALIGFILRFMEKNVDKTLIWHPSLVKSCRDKFLEFLELDNMPGITEFISKNINRRSSSTTPSKHQ